MWGVPENRQCSEKSPDSPLLLFIFLAEPVGLNSFKTQIPNWEGFAPQYLFCTVNYFSQMNGLEERNFRYFLKFDLF